MAIFFTWAAGGAGGPGDKYQVWLCRIPFKRVVTVNLSECWTINKWKRRSRINKQSKWEMCVENKQRKILLKRNWKNYFRLLDLIFRWKGNIVLIIVFVFVFEIVFVFLLVTFPPHVHTWRTCYSGGETLIWVYNLSRRFPELVSMPYHRHHHHHHYCNRHHHHHHHRHHHYFHHHRHTLNSLAVNCDSSAI